MGRGGGEDQRNKAPTRTLKVSKLGAVTASASQQWSGG